MAQSGELKQIDILLVEDNSSDVRLTREALREVKIANTLHVVYDGVEAMEFLKRSEKFPDAPTPDLVLLDLNLPRMNGREVLAEIKTNVVLKTIPVIVLTMSSAEEDIMHAYRHNANCYITKPVDFKKFLEVVRGIDLFWFTIATLPGGRR